MQLILAIDSDPRRSEQLATLVRARLTVDLVQATSAGEGLHALKDRIPDLILTAPLLSPFDDGVLGEYLRELGAAGAHVQTVRIPVLNATPKKKALAKSLFSLGRKTRTSPAAPDGCDPKVFADEISHYLRRAADDRQMTMGQAAPPALEIESASNTIDSHEAAIGELAEQSVAEFEAALAEAESEPAAEVIEPESTGYALEPTTAGTEYVVDEHEVASHSLIDVVEVAPEEPIQDLELPAVEPPPRLLVPVEVRKPQAVVVEPKPQTVVTAPEPQPHVHASPAGAAPANAHASRSSFETALAAIRAAWVKPDAAATASSSVADNPRAASQREVDLTHDALDDVVGPDSHDSKTNGHSFPDSPSNPPAQRKLDKPKPRPEKARGRKMGASDGRPVQDEFGVYDANQCGFPALVDRLDEVADSDETPNRTVTTRVISVR